MYTFVSSMSKTLQDGREWVTTDISGLPLEYLFNTYSRVIVVLSNVLLPENVAVDLSAITPSVRTMTISLNQFLIANGNRTLPALPSVPTLDKKYAHYADGIKAGYAITPVNPLTSVSSVNREIDKPWLYLTKNGIDYNAFYHTCLVNVNGFFHLTDTDGTGIYVVDGMKTSRKANLNQIGIYSFADIGTIQIIPIKSNMVYKQNPNQKYKDHVFINTGIDDVNKTPMLVLGGYLHVLDDTTFTAIGPNIYRIDFNNLPFLDRFFESRKYLDFHTLPLSKTVRNEDQISVSEFYSDANILAYLTLSQSFIVLLDNNDVSVSRALVRKTPFPNMYIGYEEPVFPLVVQAGKVTNYWSTFEDGQYSLTCTDTLMPNPIYDTVDADAENSVDNANCTYKRHYASDAYFLKVSSVII